MPRKVYLSDGAYAQFTEYGDLELTTENGIDVQNRVVLDPIGLIALIAYIAELGVITYLTEKPDRPPDPGVSLRRLLSNEDGRRVGVSRSTGRRFARCRLFLAWRALSEDAQHWAFWLGIIGTAVTAVVGGAWLGWWAYFYEGMPLSIVLLQGLAAAAALFVIGIARAHHVGEQ